MANCCPHVTKATGLIEDDEWNRIVTNPAVCRICQEQGNNFWLCLYPGCHFIGCSDADGGQDHSTQHFNDHPTHCIQVSFIRFIILYIDFWRDLVYEMWLEISWKLRPTEFMTQYLFSRSILAHAELGATYATKKPQHHFWSDLEIKSKTTVLIVIIKHLVEWKMKNMLPKRQILWNQILLMITSNIGKKHEYQFSLRYS